MEQENIPPEVDLNDSGQQQELFNRYIAPNLNLVYRLCIDYASDKRQVQDYYNEVLSVFYRYIRTYDPRQPLVTWIHIVTKRFVFEQNRRRGKVPLCGHSDLSGLTSGDDAPSWRCMDEHNYRLFYSDDVLRAMDSLKPMYREALLLQQAGYRLDEIVEIAYRNGSMRSRSMDTMKSRIFLAKQQMRKLILPDGSRRED